ncbi:PREDICTED: uncharacterized protein LOC108777494 [Cyphomyrmex costatus]|uniref:uncharacterized protein LOC108777494 n=1 Tax=Cyphomyrmex costatus TaxID=456900 RepID=UPI0008522377|nr:PREDICTED: uncharacterized protein LOC108777494 [Cyphomyrmex costatus]
MFNELLTRVRPFLEKSGPRRPHSVELKLALTLSFLAHGDSVNSKAWEFRIGRSTVYTTIHEVCRALWHTLQLIVLPEPNERKWSEIAESFFEKWQFPNCVGALDGKHIRIQAPTHSGSQFFNYKKYFSIVFLAICDANHKFVWVDIGQYGGISDSGVWSNTELTARVREKTAEIPGPQHLPGTAIKTNHVFLGDEIFPLDLHLLKSYNKKELTDNRRIFNYRLSKARLSIENTFGILCARWQILNKPIKFSLTNLEEVTKALICLHNYIMMMEERFEIPQRRYCSQNFVDRENADHEIMEGVWHGITEKGTLFENIQKMGGNSGSNPAKAQRDVLCEYFVTDVGCKQTPWQYEYVFRSANINT